MCLNIRGVLNNFAELETMVYQNCFEIIMLTETHLTNEEDSEIKLNGYEVIRCDSNSKHTGGVAVYIRNEWHYEVLKIEKCDSEFWWLVIKCRMKHVCYVIAIVYRSPSMVKKKFCQYFEQWIEELMEYNCEVIVAGDLNVNWAENDVNKLCLEQSIVDNGCKQIVKEYTRITVNTRTIIDWIVTNVVNVEVNVDHSLKISDHETICINLNVSDLRIEQKRKTVRRFKYNKQNMISDINESMNDIENLSCVNEKAKKYEEILKTAINNQTVECNEYNNGRYNWYSAELQEMKVQKVNLYNRAVLTRKKNDWSAYINVRSEYVTKIKKVKNEFIINKLQGAQNQKELWMIMKELVLKKNDTASIKEVIFDSVRVEKEIEIANEFNKYFVKSINEINESIPYCQYFNNVVPVSCTFNLEQVNESELKEIIKGFNNKRDINYLSAPMLIDCWEVTGSALLKIINQSFREGIFPEPWKQSTVIPIKKVTGTKLCEEYRPINMLPTYEKIIEKCVQIQLESYVEKNNLLIAQQSGFRKGHSCETALNWLIMQWKSEIECGNVICACFLDFKRAFETVDREILIAKLEQYGVNGKEQMWFKSYLRNRMQRTKVNNTTSEQEETKLGVPQGAVLGTLLFLMYINDINTVLSHAKIMLFADDALIYVCAKDKDECISKITNDLNKLSAWLNMNKLKLNTNKTKCMVINGADSADVRINGELIECVVELKYLGVIIDKKLNFKNHIDYVCKKIGKKIGFFRRIRKNVTPMCAVHIYNTMIKPHFEYCSTMLIVCNEGMFHRMQMLQNKGMRTILYCSRYTPVRDMLNTLEWMNVKQRVIYGVLVFIFKIKNNILPKYLQDSLNYVSDVQPYNLRNRNDFRIQYASSTNAQNSLLYKGLILWNELSNELKIERSVNVFKRKCAIFVKQFH